MLPEIRCSCKGRVAVTASSGSSSDSGRSRLPAMAVFSPNCGRQFRVVCNWTWNWEDAALVGTTWWWCVVSKKVLL